MNDAERDAWLREALRHAPDAGAVPPSGVSEAILLKARAAARATTPPRRGAARDAAPTGSFAAFWAWLARPPVAAGFASVMAATLVGLMWWDRPMDEGMPRPPAIASDRADVAPPPAATAPVPAAPPQAQPTDATTPTASAKSDAVKNAAADDGAARRRQRSVAEQAAAGNADVVAKAKTAPDSRQLEPLAKESALPAERKNEVPAPFPSTEAQREAPAGSARKSLDSAAIDAKKDDEARRPLAANAVESAAVTPTPSAATSALAARPSLPAVAAAPAMAPAPSAEPARQRAFGELREKDPAGLAAPAPAPAPPAAPAPAPFRDELERSRSGPAARAEAAKRADAPTQAAAPARLLAAIGAEGERWSRQTAAGDIVALDAGWRAWLADLDAATSGRWRSPGAVGAAADADGAVTLRLVNAGRVAAIVRIDGATVHLDASPGTGGDRWQATLGPASAEQLRTTSRRLAP